MPHFQYPHPLSTKAIQEKLKDHIDGRATISKQDAKTLIDVLAERTGHINVPNDRIR